MLPLLELLRFKFTSIKGDITSPTHPHDPYMDLIIFSNSILNSAGEILTEESKIVIFLITNAIYVCIPSLINVLSTVKEPFLTESYKPIFFAVF